VAQHEVAQHRSSPRPPVSSAINVTDLPLARKDLLFDAVIFDLDGTLVATERFWVAAACAGARRAFAELGLARAMPSAEQWMSMVGTPVEKAFSAVFPDLSDAQRRLVIARCVEEEHAALRAGGAALMPGAVEVLTTLRERGAKLGIASNCGESYLTSMLDRLGLRALVDEPRCLDSPGIDSKAEMIADLLATFGTRSCAMVGDRSTDAEAAHANAIPHVHLAQGFAPVDERVACEARIDDLGALLPRLEQRARWIEGSLAQIGALRRSKRALTIGITGAPASGKTLFARDLVKLFEARGMQASVIALDSFARKLAHPSAGAGDDALQRSYDVETLMSAVLEPRQRGEPTRMGAWGGPVAPDQTLIVEGSFLLDPRLRLKLDRVIHLRVDEHTALARCAGRGASPEALTRFRREIWPAQRAFEAAFDPATRADLVLEHDNPLGPAPC
jgi:phosphoglycolate phosphatase-like HAD superfamily hydrolase/uridine kinase